MDEVDYFSTETDFRSMSSKAATGAAYIGLAQAFRVFLSIASQITLSRLLLPAQFGIVAMVAPVLALVGLFNNLGLSQAVVQRQSISQADLTALYWLGIVASAICAGAVMAVSPLVALAYRQPSVGPVCMALACQMPLGAIAGHSSALMARKLRFGALAAIEVSSATVGLIVSVVAALLGASYWALVVGQLSSALTQAMGARWLSGWRPSRPKWSTSVAPMLRFGASLTGFELLSIFSLYCDNVIVGLLKGPGMLGLFDRAFSLTMRPVASITAPVSRIANPLLSRLIAEPKLYRRAFISLLQGFIFLGAPGLLAGSIMANEIVRTLLGKAWVGAGPMVQWICLAAMFTTLSGSSNWLFTSQNRPNEQLQCGLISSGLVLVSMLAGIAWGPVGIAKSYAIFAPLVHGIFIWRATRTGPVGRLDIVRGICPLVIAIPCGGLAVYMFLKLPGWLPIIQILAAIALSYVVVAVIALLFPEGRRSASDLAKILSRLRRRPAVVAQVAAATEASIL